MKIPVCTPDITIEDVEAVTECAKSGWVSGISPYVDAFEKNFAQYIGAKYAVATNSGSTALQLALAAYDIKNRDEVIVPDFTMVASPNAVKNLGAKPVFVDCEMNTWNIDPAKIEDKITKKTKAIMPVHVYGHSCHMDAIVRIAEYYDLKVIDDAAEAFGAKFCGHKVGCFTDATAFSLYANKTITSGEGGIVTTASKEVYDKMQWLKAQAFGRGGKHFYHEALGYGFRMSGLQAALGNSQLKRADQYVKARRDHAAQYIERLLPLFNDCKLLFPVQKSYAENTYWMFTIILLKHDRDKVIAELAQKGIETRPVFTPMHQQPIYMQKGEFPVSEWVGSRGINLPSSNTLTVDEIDYVCNALKEALK
ncbi:MAG: DegT/DnrJ/EryC1/StrS family aminotransferase [Candidatus Bathyarchaeia archaeon]|jgi:perosamine synthetase